MTYHLYVLNAANDQLASTDFVINVKATPTTINRSPMFSAKVKSGFQGAGLEQSSNHVA